MFTSKDWQTYSPSALITPEVEQQHTRLVLDYYQETLLKNGRAMHYLQHTRGLKPPELIKTFSLGFVDRTLSQKLPKRQSFEGEMIRGLLQRNGIVKPNGREAFRGMIIFPVFDDTHCFIGAYGRRIAKYIRKGSECYYAVSGQKYCFYRYEALQENNHIVLCLSPIEVLSLWCLGIKNAISPLSIHHLGQGHVMRLLDNGVKSVDVAFGNTSFAHRMFDKVYELLRDTPITVHQISFEPEEDINSALIKSYLLEVLCQQFHCY